MINYWIDREQSAYLLESQRLLGAMFDLGICRKDQLAKVLGWTLKKVTWTIDDIRQKAKRNKENPDHWIKFWLFKKRDGTSMGNVFTLGKKGIEFVCSILEQEVGKRKPLSGNVLHFLGTNDILIRLIDAGHRPELWYSQKEVASYLFHKFGEKEFIYDLDRVTDVKYKRGKVPLDPDAMVQMTPNGERFFVEFDTGSQVSHVIESKSDRYFQMMPKLEPFSVIYVTQKKSRVKLITEAHQTVYREIYQGKIKPYPAYVFLEGDETPFLCGISKANPIIDIDQFETKQITIMQENKTLSDPLQEKINQLETELADTKKRLSEAESRLNQKVDIEKQLEKWYQGLESLSGGLFGKALANYLKENPFPLHKK